MDNEEQRDKNFTLTTKLKGDNYIWKAGLHCLCYACLVCTILFACKTTDKSQSGNTTTTGLTHWILKKGTGAPTKVGHEVLIHETMSYTNGSLIFSSYTMTGPIKVLIGARQVIAGLDEGLIGMKQGEIRKLKVPPSLSKRTDPPAIPHPDSTLIYVVELVEILRRN